MTVRVRMKNGAEFTVASELGSTVEEVVDKIVQGGLTGSAAPLADVWVKTRDGFVRYGDVESFRTSSSEDPA